MLLPWPLFFRLARGFSRFSWLFKEEAELAVAAVNSTDRFTADSVWERHYRLYKIVDAADPWLCRFRGRGWIKRYVDVKGEWPATIPFVASSMHYGAGLWALRHINLSRAPISMVLRPHAEWESSFSRPMQAYLKAYEHAIVDAGGGPITHTGPGLRQRFKHGLETNTNQLVLIDVPSNKNTLSVDFLGQTTYFASGLIDLSRSLGQQVVPYVMTLDFNTGRRKLVIGTVLPENLNLAQAMQSLAGFFDPYVRQQSEGWQLWGQYSAFVNPNCVAGEG